MNELDNIRQGIKLVLNEVKNQVGAGRPWLPFRVLSRTSNDSEVWGRLNCYSDDWQSHFIIVVQVNLGDGVGVLTCFVQRGDVTVSKGVRYECQISDINGFDNWVRGALEETKEYLVSRYHLFEALIGPWADAVVELNKAFGPDTGFVALLRQGKFDAEWAENILVVINGIDFPPSALVPLHLLRMLWSLREEVRRYRDSVDGEQRVQASDYLNQLQVLVSEKTGPIYA